MHVFRRSLLTWLLVAWMALESGTVALLHDHVHACGGRTASATQEDCAGAANSLEHAGCSHDCRGGDAEARRSSAVASDAWRRHGGISGTEFSELHPHDCSICRHFHAARVLLVAESTDGLREVRTLAGVELPVKPVVSLHDVPRTRGPPSA